MASIPSYTLSNGKTTTDFKEYCNDCVDNTIVDVQATLANKEIFKKYQNSTPPIVYYSTRDKLNELLKTCIEDPHLAKDVLVQTAVENVKNYLRLSDDQDKALDSGTYSSGGFHCRTERSWEHIEFLNKQIDWQKEQILKDMKKTPGISFLGDSDLLNYINEKISESQIKSK